ncbi:hypothetical protein F5Y17DRAFT_109715 [Xylariaceae sp. FL0594]|nr:hypothetical protein F5Y17DRAFT_109715 [Xylariaceae sp. FL0594]
MLHAGRANLWRITPDRVSISGIMRRNRRRRVRISYQIWGIPIHLFIPHILHFRLDSTLDATLQFPLVLTSSNWHAALLSATLLTEECPPYKKDQGPGRVRNSRKLYLLRHLGLLTTYLYLLALPPRQTCTSPPSTARSTYRTTRSAAPKNFQCVGERWYVRKRRLCLVSWHSRTLSLETLGLWLFGKSGRG